MFYLINLCIDLCMHIIRRTIFRRTSDPTRPSLFAPPKSTLQSQWWHIHDLIFISIRLYLRWREIRYIDLWPYFCSEITDLLVSLLGGFSGCHGRRAFHGSFQNSDDEIEDSFPTFWIQEIVGHGWFNLPVGIDGHGAVSVSVAYKILA